MMRLTTERNLPGKRIDRATTPGAPWQSVRLVNEAVRAASGWVQPLRAELQRAIVGREHLVDRLLICLLTDGHLLVDGGPGLGKARTMKALAAAIGAACERVTLSADMTPADLLGDLVLDPDTGVPTMGPGPLFSNLVLAEDLHRTPPMVQNALLRAMEDRSVKILSETHSLPDPFLVVASIHRGPDEEKHPLTESQADRFLMQVCLSYPDSDEEREILDVAGHGRRSPVVRTVLTTVELLRARRVVHSVYANQMIKKYAVALVSATRGQENDLSATRGQENDLSATRGQENDLSATRGQENDLYATRGPGNGRGTEKHPGRNPKPTPITAHGASPRATVDLIRAARAYAFLGGRGYVTPQDVKAVAPDVLRHRLTLRSRDEDAGLTSGDVIRRILDTVAVP